VQYVLVYVRSGVLGSCCAARSGVNDGDEHHDDNVYFGSSKV
jgi:hypothetical protein